MNPDKTKSTQHRQAALERWPRLDEAERREATRPGRQAFLARFEDAPTPSAALRGYFSRLGSRGGSTQSRR
jgi:hypothetical protein